MNWIKVEDKLPDYESLVLLFDEIDGRCTGCLCGDQEEFYSHPSKEILSKVTHWMPSPDYPKD